MRERSQSEVKEIIRKWYKVLKIPEQYGGDFQAYLENTTILPHITPEEYEEAGGEENILYCLYFCERLQERYLEKGIDLKILYDTLQELFLWTRSCSRRKGKLWLENLWWVKLHLTMKLFRLGRLNFCMGLEHNHLPQWELPMGTPIMEVHIPRADSLTREDCKKSFAQARTFFATYFPEFQYRYFTCHSWLLDSKLKELLPQDSNIIKFQEMFRLVSETESQETLHYVFGAGTTRENLSEKECSTSLASKVKERVLNGETFHESYGILK
ncbi:MAG: hypothetical protein E7293_07095 [Lachnospiraceae bacterium]|nr:hypothetical protein [Lachnospiraceae bacterium]